MVIKCNEFKKTGVINERAQRVSEKNIYGDLHTA